MLLYIRVPMLLKQARPALEKMYRSIALSREWMVETDGLAPRAEQLDGCRTEAVRPLHTECSVGK